MKITWFGNAALRLHYGGEIVVVDADGAVGVERAEIVSGADRVLLSDDPDINPFDPERFVVPRPRRAIDFGTDDGGPTVARHAGGLVLASADEPVVVTHRAQCALAYGPWADGAVFVLADPSGLPAVRGALDVARLRLVVLALAEADRDGAVDALRPSLGRAGLMVVENGMALEV